MSNVCLLRFSQTPPSMDYEGSQGASMAQCGIAVQGLWFVYSGQECVADVSLDYFKEKSVSLHTHVGPDWQRKGVGSAIYDWAEGQAKAAGLALIPSDDQTPDAKAFWQARIQHKLLQRRNLAARLTYELADAPPMISAIKAGVS